MAMAHYLDALVWQRQIVQLQTIFGGKNPHPNVLVGGVPAAISVHSGEGTATTAVNEVGLQKVSEIIALMRQFITEVYVPDLIAIGGFYKDWFAKGYGEGTGNFMTYGDFPNAATLDPKTFLVPRGAILNRDLSAIHEVDLTASGDIQEFVAHSWYDYDAGKTTGLHPYQGETRLAYSGPTPPYQNLDAGASYSWIKSPRWKGHAMEMGPLARVLMMYASGHAPTVALTDQSLARLDLPLDALYSVMGRNLARALECQILTDALPGWLAQLQANIAAGDVRTFNETKWERSTWPSHAQGVGCLEAPRGSLAHWIVIDDGLISNYQAVVPTTWNAGPRDAAGVAGPYEAALEGIQLADPKQPLEILRTVHSFDPCLACAVHLVDPDGEELLQVRVQ
jgi:hydrogenase large subunit